MCTPCVYQLEKFYMFRKLCRKTDSKYRSFVRKVKSKRITLLEELSDDDDDVDNDTGDTDRAFVQEYERNMVQDQLNAQLSKQVTTGRKHLLQRIKKTLYETIDNLVDEEYIPNHIVMKTNSETNSAVTPRKAPPKTPTSSPRYSTRKKKHSSPVSISMPSEIGAEEEEGDKTIASNSGDDAEEDDEDEDAMEQDYEGAIPSVTLTGDAVQDEYEVDYATDVPVTESESLAIVLKSGLIHKCSSCGRKFSSVEKLKKHQVYHKTEKNVCRDCGKCFSSSGSLFRHAKIHSAVKAFTCDVCEKGFTQKGSLQRHALVHQKDRPFSCTACDRTFSQRNLLVDHEAKAHSASNVTYIFHCNECPKVWLFFQTYHPSICFY